MSLEFIPTPQQTGRIIGLCITEMKLVNSLFDSEGALLQDAGITAQVLLDERFLLCVAAAEYAINQALPGSSVGQEVKYGLRTFLTMELGERRVFPATADLNSIVTYYTEAATDDLSRGQLSPGEVSEIGLAFGDRLLDLGEETETRIRACFILVSAVPNVLWITQSNVTFSTLQDARLISTH